MYTVLVIDILILILSWFVYLLANTYLALSVDKLRFEEKVNMLPAVMKLKFC